MNIGRIQASARDAYNFISGHLSHIQYRTRDVAIVALAALTVTITVIAIGLSLRARNTPIIPLPTQGPGPEQIPTSTPTITPVPASVIPLPSPQPEQTLAPASTVTPGTAPIVPPPTSQPQPSLLPMPSPTPTSVLKQRPVLVSTPTSTQTPTSPRQSTSSPRPKPTLTPPPASAPPIPTSPPAIASSSQPSETKSLITTFYEELEALPEGEIENAILGRLVPQWGFLSRRETPLENKAVNEFLEAVKKANFFGSEKCKNLIKNMSYTKHSAINIINQLKPDQKDEFKKFVSVLFRISNIGSTKTKINTATSDEITEALKDRDLLGSGESLFLNLCITRYSKIFKSAS